MLKIGVTGGIGSGKSAICRVFETCGAPVYDADSAAKRLMQENHSLRSEIIKHFGDVYDKNGSLQRMKLAENVFGNPDNLQKLNRLVHPVVIEDYNKWQTLQIYAYVLKESAILFESKTNLGLDHVIFVEAPETLRIKRIMQRDNRTEQQVREIIKNQMSEEKKKELTDFIILNNDEVPIIPQVWTLHEKILNVSK